MHQLGCVSLVLKRVIEESITHAHHALLVAPFKVIPELLEPHPVVWLARLRDLVLQKLVNHVDVVDDVKDEGFHLDEE